MARGRPSKKAHIIQSAGVLFAKQGYQSTSVDQVVAEASVSKPTVYSNFPTKLVLWESVLEAVIERAKKELEDKLDELQANGSGFMAGWIALWHVWISQQERLAVYRIFMGEQHKMGDSSIALFDQFESVLEETLQDWLKESDVPIEGFFALKAITKEALLIPSVLNRQCMGQEDTAAHLALLLK